ncbi:MAG: hypothetical protein H6851_17310 [Geminicoccaceae bacterium]|nr:hypothetical protein [Geminicoccaceae bacterium]MCB9945363.1 hypothetical protein [Geminicoccaceae bacterium]
MSAAQEANRTNNEIDRSLDNVLELARTHRDRGGDPVIDYVAVWMALEVFHDNCRLTEEGWSFLTEHLQRPIELRLMERKPATYAGALKALNLASYIMENLEQSEGPESDGAWYRRLRLHLVKSARDLLRDRLEANEPRRGRGSVEE